MGFNFSEEEITKMYQVYKNALNEIQEETHKVVEQMTAKARELKYEPVIKLSTEAVTYYNEGLKKAATDALTDWQSSELSFTSVMEKMSAGDDAKSRSRDLEGQIEEGIQSWRSVDSAQLNGIDTANWRCEVDDFEAIKQIIDQYVDSLVDKQDQYANTIEHHKEENEIYVSIEPVVLQTIAIVAEGFKSGINASFTDLAQEFKTREDTILSLSGEAADVAAKKTQRLVSDGISALKARVKQIFD